MNGGEICVSKSIGLACSGKEITIFALFYFVFKGKFQVQAPWGAYILRGDLMEGFLHYDFGGLIFGGSYTMEGLIIGILQYDNLKRCCFYKGLVPANPELPNVAGIGLDAEGMYNI